MCPTPKDKAEPASPGSAASTKSSNSGSNNEGKAIDSSMYPSDWPQAGPVDLKIHDLPHFSSSIEWWYVNAHLDLQDNNSKKMKKKKEKSTKEEENEESQVSVFASFFRAASGYDEETHEYVFVHYAAWAIMDHRTNQYYNVSLVDPRYPELIQEWYEKSKNDHTKDNSKYEDKQIMQATMEVVRKGKMPYPDRLLKKNPTILGKDLSRLPDKQNKEYEQWQQKLAEYQQQQTEQQQQHQKTESTAKAANANNSKKKKKKGSCCFRAKSVLNSVVHPELPLLTLAYDDNTFVKNSDGSYTLHLEDNDVHHVKASLTFTPKTDAVRNGVNGVVDGHGLVQDFFYYCLPNCDVTGSVTLPTDDDKPDRYDAKIQKKNYFVLDEHGNACQDPMETKTHKVSGKGWYDHQFGCMKPDDGQHKDVHKDNIEGKAGTQTSYSWVSLQLDNGHQFSCAEYFFHKSEEAEDRANDKPHYFANLYTPKGERIQLDPSEFTFKEKGDPWVSMRTFCDYPVHWEISVPSRNIQLDVKAVFDQQEFPTVHSTPAFWEGCVAVTGTFGDKEISGRGFVERKGFCPPESQTIKGFFKRVTRETLKSVQKILPFNPEGEKLNELVSHKDNQHYTDHLDNQQFSKALVEPIRLILDRGGKSWRSYVALACCDIVGGNSQPVKDWLALPELAHVGSMIVDDVEDRSLIRRGGPCSHIVYGEDVAINAGTMAYFMGQIVIYQGDGDPQQKVDIYNMYFEAMRAAHCGQAMDIHGLNYMMSDVVENGGDLCLQRVIAIHRLKTSAPVSYFTRMGSRLGGGSEAQSNGLAVFAEALGIAFQIVDDVLNLRGFVDGLKTKGEDITAGKVTYPVAVAMSRLKKEDRAKLWEYVSSKPEDIETIGKAVALIDKVNAIDDSFQDAKDTIEEAWQKLDPLVVDSMVKLNLRAFSLYILDRGMPTVG
ncbi:Heterodimeric geranylgeranyl pyrophosphate synthase large subunit [Seminavis robusta]|uniref:Heterodimeric geranylgeranyl pyrophosphate synthase large subunit n=1 Tax=Seminavis robusta TaxID=568900 RepID=A0A9N8E1A2_9STRA|nr:Heterodimeric geranylgeranyl pyrophosphate synthase large subunit [Seminavis robusta]|eukprot:Sro447_g144930.1 Heterodimeric geranylgeranyl pyrophosphate synthase large subunit (941) ;mRNA; f:45024-47846